LNPAKFVPRFDLYRNPNPRAVHGLYLDVQSDLVSTSPVPKALLREHRGRLASDDQLRVESAIEFMLRGY
jgi:hypothetical protein